MRLGLIQVTDKPLSRPVTTVESHSFDSNDG